MRTLLAAALLLAAACTTPLCDHQFEADYEHGACTETWTVCDSTDERRIACDGGTCSCFEGEQKTRDFSDGALCEDGLSDRQETAFSKCGWDELR